MQVPHFNEWPVGYSMLGLGDIMIPSFFLSLALRFDYRFAIIHVVQEMVGEEVKVVVVVLQMMTILIRQ